MEFANGLRLVGDEIHPIDVVESMAIYKDWTFDRLTENRIAMSVEGQWRSYSLTLSWAPGDEVLQLVCTFEMEPPEDKLPVLYDLLNRCNDKVWIGAFTFWQDRNLMAWRHGLCLAGGQMVGEEQVDRLIGGAVLTAEQFYPAFQLALWGDRPPDDALTVAIAEAYGRA